MLAPPTSASARAHTGGRVPRGLTGNVVRRARNRLPCAAALGLLGKLGARTQYVPTPQEGAAVPPARAPGLPSY